ncbi:MAG: ATP-dependent Clp protease ATP-binding subunit [Candidatus Woykebacteria bacterium]
MLAFSPEFSKIFKEAALVNLFSSPLVVIVRLLIVISLSLPTIYSFANGSKMSYLWAALLTCVFMLEVFYHYKVLEAKPSKTVEESAENLADYVDLSLAKTLLKANDLNNPSVIFNAMRKDSKITSFFNKGNIGSGEISSLEAALAKENLDPSRLLLKSKEFAEKENRDYIDNLDLLLSLFSQSSAFSQAALTVNLKEDDLLNIAYLVRHLFEKEATHFWERAPTSFGIGLASLWEGGWTLETEKYTTNISNSLLRRQVSHKLIGRAEIIDQVEGILSREGKRNVILTGEPGVGKTSIVYALASSSAHGQLPESLKYKRFLEFDLTSLLSGREAGVLAERLNNIISEISHAKDVVLFIPEIEYLASGEGGGADISGLILETLKSGSLQIIGTTTKESYKKFIEGKGAFAESFETIEVPEPSTTESIRILEEAATKIEPKEKINVSYKAIEKAVELSKKYMVDRVLPGKAIDLLDEASSFAHLHDEKILTVEIIENIVSQKTKAPVRVASGAEKEQLLHLEEELHRRIVDQEEAVKSISQAIRRARALNRETKRPIGVFLFLGPTGVGKTETAKALSAIYFGSEEKIIRIDMSEFQEENSINRLIGAPPGSKDFGTGGQFTEKIRENPFTTVLLDEMEKAHLKIQEAFLPVLDEGVLTDSSGKEIIFTNTIIIATSNAGAEFIRESIQNNAPLDTVKKELLENLQRDGVFKPEFLNRFDDIIVYKPLSQEDLKQIIKFMTSNLSKRMEKQDVAVLFDESALSWLAQKGYDPTYGARPLRRVIQNEIEARLAEKILSGEIGRGKKVNVKVAGDNLIFESV